MIRPLSVVAAWSAFGLAAAPPLTSAAPAVIPLSLPSGKVIRVEVMVSEQDREMGLMFRPSLPGDKGLLFVFPRSDFYGFWMKNCRFPIDMVWLDEAKQVVHLAEAVPPCRSDPCPTYQPLRRARYVIELNAGQARRERATVGASVSFALPR
jgi:uncharacterized membrane protein (UPF0127 family)